MFPPSLKKQRLPIGETKHCWRRGPDVTFEECAETTTAGGWPGQTRARTPARARCRLRFRRLQNAKSSTDTATATATASHTSLVRSSCRVVATGFATLPVFQLAALDASTPLLEPFSVSYPLRVSSSTEDAHAGDEFEFPHTSKQMLRQFTSLAGLAISCSPVLDSQQPQERSTILESFRFIYS